MSQPKCLRCYLTSLALKGQPPSAIATGEEFSAPIRGVFVRTSPGRLAYFRLSSVRTVMWLLSQYVGAAGDHQAAARWLGRVTIPTDPAKLSLVDAMIGLDTIPSLITAGKFAEAIDAALRYCHADLMFRESKFKNREEMESGVNAADSWNGLQVQQRQAIESGAAALAVLPTAFWVGRRMVESKEEGIRLGQRLPLPVGR